MKREKIIEMVMQEFKEGKLKSSSGDIVTKRDQAIAIALSKANSKKFDDGGTIDNQNYEMVKGDNKAIIHHAEELKMILTKNKNIPTWAVVLLAKAEQNLSDVTHYLDGKIKYDSGGVLPEILSKVYGEKVEFLDKYGLTRIGIVNDLFPTYAEVIVDDNFVKVPNWYIIRFLSKEIELNSSVSRDIRNSYLVYDDDKSGVLETMKKGGKLLVANLGAYLLAGQTAKNFAPESVDALDKKLASKIYNEPKPSIWEDRGLKYTDGKNVGSGEEI